MRPLTCECGSTDIRSYFDETSQRKILYCEDCGNEE